VPERYLAQKQREHISINQMSNKERQEKIEAALVGQDLLKILSVDDINHKPHPFTIGAQHIERYHLNISKPCAGYVDDHGRYSNVSKPGFHKCGLSLKEHTHDTVGFLQLLRNGTEEEGKTILKKFVDDIGVEFVSGFLFVETEEEFRIN
jgi:hypothetical protein